MTGRDGADRGVVLVLIALAVTAVFVFVALVIDLGQARSDRRANKLLTDVAAAAGAGDIRRGPWPAVCAAYRHLVSNAGFGPFDSETWRDQAGTTTYAAAPGTCPAAAPSGPTCTGDPATWASFRGVADGGRVVVEIRSGYQMPDPAFAEDAAIGGDAGDPCAQVAVTITEREDPVFSRVFGADPITTRVRSVARLTVGLSDIAALVVLEKTDCRAIDASANTGGGVVVAASESRPGIIQVDSDGSASSQGDNCQGGKKVVEGSALPNRGGPNVRAESTGSSPPVPGEIGINALRTNPGRAHTEACSPSPTPPATCTITPVPVWRQPVGRTPLDARYRAGVESVTARARTQVAAPPAGYRRLTEILGAANCQQAEKILEDGREITDQNVYVDCDSLSVSGGRVVFSAADAGIIAKGSLSFGPSAALEVRDARTILLGGSTQGANPVGFNVAGTLQVNTQGSTAPCGDRSARPPTKTTALVVLAGSFEAGAQGAISMCATTVVMGDQAKGTVNVGGAGRLDWTAPNRVTGPANQAAWDDQEDLALWTEATAESKLGGQAGSSLAGVFALPNANPFTFAGQGTGDIRADAQFWARKLRVSGTALLRMAPNPDDSIPIFEVRLVR